MSSKSSASVDEEFETLDLGDSRRERRFTIGRKGASSEGASILTFANRVMATYRRDRR
jgi:hypothetical protein